MSSSVSTTKSVSTFNRIWTAYGMLLIFLVIFVASCVFIPNFATIINMKGLGLAISMSGMVACGMLFCLAAGEIDLSVASVIACAGVVTAVAINATQSVWLGVLAGIGLGAAVGLVNGFVIAKLKINSLITTLASMQIARGLGYIISDGKAVGITKEEFFDIGYLDFLGIPLPIWFTIVCIAIFGFLLSKTTYGRNTLAIGGNEEAARMTSGQPMTSVGFELVAISACVLGGVSLTGGVAKISFIIAGVLILGTIENAMNLLNISPFAQYVVRGLILLIAVIFDRYKQKIIR